MRLSCYGIRFNETHIMLAREVLEMLVLTRNTGNVLEQWADREAAE